MALRANTGEGVMPDKSRMQVWLFAACLLGGWHSAACAQNIDSIQLTLRSRICPPETSRVSLVNGSCKPEADRLAAARSSESNPAYADLMACNRRETEQNRAILQYNQFMETCESSERSKQEAERKKAAEDARTKAQEAKAAASKASLSNQDIDKRLEQAKLKAETLGRKNQDQGRALAEKAQEVAQAKFLEGIKQAEEERRAKQPRGNLDSECARAFFDERGLRPGSIKRYMENGYVQRHVQRWKALWSEFVADPHNRWRWSCKGADAIFPLDMD